MPFHTITSLQVIGVAHHRTQVYFNDKTLASLILVICNNTCLKEKFCAHTTACHALRKQWLGSYVLEWCAADRRLNVRSMAEVLQDVSFVSFVCCRGHRCSGALAERPELFNIRTCKTLHSAQAWKVTRDLLPACITGKLAICQQGVEIAHNALQ